MEAELADDIHDKVVGFEANGGFLLGFDVYEKGKILKLMTRDCMIPILLPMITAKGKGQSMSRLVGGLLASFTHADRLQYIETTSAKTYLDALIADSHQRQMQFAAIGTIIDIDVTDGMRMAFSNGHIVNLRHRATPPNSKFARRRRILKYHVNWCNLPCK